MTIMEALKIETIRPSADLRNHYREISCDLKEGKRPIFITVKGRGDSVRLSIPQYEQMQAELELLRILSEAEEDVRMGRMTPAQAPFDIIRKKLAETYA